MSYNEENYPNQNQYKTQTFYKLKCISYCLLISISSFSLLTTASRNSMHLFKSGLESQNCLKRSLPIGCLSQSWL